MTVDLKGYVKEWGLEGILDLATPSKAKGAYEAVDPANVTPYPPEQQDLIRLHSLVVSRKVTTVLEFGVGYSTVVFAHAMAKNRELHGDYVTRHLRRSNSFEVHSVDAMAKFIDSTREMLPGDLRDGVVFHESAVEMAEWNGRVCTLYRELPNICPDLVYLDAPHQFAPTNNVRGISTAHGDRVPMSADLLAMEHFFLPGTLIVVDGRTANARFLKANFQRTWQYTHDAAGDFHLFELVEAPLGRYNLAQIEFCLGRDWLAKTSSGGDTN